VCSQGVTLRQKNTRIEIGQGGKLAGTGVEARSADKLNCL
jgi:hypothetical protein